MIAQRLTLARLTFTHGRIQALYARMLAPCLDTHSGESGQGPEMYIPAEITSVRPRTGLVGPLKKTEGPTVSRRPWRDEQPNCEEAVPGEVRAAETTPKPVPPVVEPPTLDDSTVASEPT
jgi:hypothetical protein